MVHRDLDLRHKLRRGETGNGFQAELNGLAEDWLELERLGSTCLSAAPTHVTRTYGPLEAPALIKP